MKPLHIDLGTDSGPSTVPELLADLEQVAQLVFWQLRRRGVSPDEIDNPSTRAAYATWLEGQAG